MDAFEILQNIMGNLPTQKSATEVPKTEAEIQERKNHLNFCRQRAIKTTSKIEDCWMSFVLDMSKNRFTKSHIAIDLGNQLFASGDWKKLSDLHTFLEGFN